MNSAKKSLMGRFNENDGRCFSKISSFNIKRARRAKPKRACLLVSNLKKRNKPTLLARLKNPNIFSLKRRIRLFLSLFFLSKIFCFQEKNREKKGLQKKLVGGLPSKMKFGFLGSKRKVDNFLRESSKKSLKSFFLLKKRRATLLKKKKEAFPKWRFKRNNQKIQKNQIKSCLFEHRPKFFLVAPLKGQHQEVIKNRSFFHAIPFSDLKHEIPKKEKLLNWVHLSKDDELNKDALLHGLQKVWQELQKFSSTLEQMERRIFETINAKLELKQESLVKSSFSHKGAEFLSPPPLKINEEEAPSFGWWNREF